MQATETKAPSQPAWQIKIVELRRRLEELEAEKIAAEQELHRLQHPPELPLNPTTSEGNGTLNLELREKVALFLTLFGARRSVYPKFWENQKTGKHGYAPACDNEWVRGICEKPQVKCAACPNQRFPELDDRAVEAHLRGDHTIGVYALRAGDSCIFLAADFDGEGWRDDIVAYRDAAKRAGVEVAIECSRSGNGAHAWTFFSEPVPAALARRLGTLLLAKASAVRPTMSLGAYDRLFPNQDTMPAGGFGNLIALPLVKKLRSAGKTVFLDDALKPYPDQWGFLAKIRRLSRRDLDQTMDRIAPLPSLESSLNPADTPFALRSDESALDLSRPAVRPGMMSGELTVRLDSQLHIPRSIPTALLAALKRLATFANPVFHEMQRLRKPTFKLPRFIFSGEWHPDRLVLPRGVADEAIALLESAGATVAVQDARVDGKRIRWTFNGELRPEQEAAVKEMAKHDCGVLCAPPGAGKTVMGCALIARHRVSTLVLVHRALLFDQWRKEAERFLDLKRKEIGVWRGQARRLTGRLDIAMLPSLIRIEDPAALFQGYGLIVVDECHHVPAVSFEALLKACPSRKIIGLTATPIRKDRLEKLLYQQCGPLRHTLAVSTEETTPRTVFVRSSSFHVPADFDQDPHFTRLMQALVDDTARTERIVGDICDCLEEGRCPLVLSERKTQLANLEAALLGRIGSADVAIYQLQSGVGKKLRQEMREEIDRRFETGGKFVLLATSSLVGEGYDLPRLDTLFFAMPISFKGRMIQYAGRLHRAHADKQEVRIYDYFDDSHPITRSMFQERKGAYRQMGYRMVMDRPDSASLFDPPPET